MNCPWHTPETPRPGKPHFSVRRANGVAFVLLRLEDGISSFRLEVGCRHGRLHLFMREAWNLAKRQGLLPEGAPMAK